MKRLKMKKLSYSNEVSSLSRFALNIIADSKVWPSGEILNQAEKYSVVFCRKVYVAADE